MSIATPPRAPQQPAPSAEAARPQPGRWDALLGPARLIVRLGGVVVKEITEILRQPVLMLMLILGPFLVLALFGLGSTGQQPPVRVVVVVPPGGPFSTDRGAYRDALSTAVNLVDVTTDRDATLQQLRTGQADVAVILPANATETITGGEQARVQILYNAIDPIKINYIQYLAYVQIAELNRQTLKAAAAQGQTQAASLQEFTGQAKAALDEIDRQIDAGDTAGASRTAGGLDRSATPIQGDLLTAVQLAAGLAALADVPPDQVGGPARQAAGRLATFRQHLLALQEDLSRGQSARDQQREDVSRLRADIEQLDQLATTLRRIPPDVVAAPFTSDTQDIGRLPASYVLFYGPAVLALLLQHVGVTFGSLSLVRERLLGATEVFAVAPIRTTEILVGKYVAYILVSLLVALGLMALMNLGLGVPVFGLDYRPEQAYSVLWGSLSPLQITILGFDLLVVLLVIVGSLGIGFLISAVSGSEYQAVQLSMLVLLTSVFFSGLFIPLLSIIVPIRYIGYVLPVTYGIDALQTLMLRSSTLVRVDLLALTAISAALFVITALLARHQLKQR